LARESGAGAAADRPGAISDGLRRAAARFGTPLYLTDVTAIDASAREVVAAFPNPWIRQYSVKANDVTAIVRLVADRGFGANVVSRGEWEIARRAGLTNDRITFEGVGKTDADLRAAVRAARGGEPLRWIAVESAEEASALAAFANTPEGPSGPASDTGSAEALDVLFRVSPDVSPDTHRGLAVGAGGSKFGMDEAEIAAAIEAIGTGGGLLRPRGLHLHVGSQLATVDAWRDAVRRTLALLALLRGSIHEFDTLDIGGGFPVAPAGSPGATPARFARELPALVEGIPPDRRPRRLAIEPGRALVARAGWIVARVLHGRDRGGPQVIVDAGMTELIRPALYGAHHPVVALTSLGRPVRPELGGPLNPLLRPPPGPGLVPAPRPGSSDDRRPTRLEGPICESTDHLGEHLLPPLQRGDLVAIADAGAYGAALSSTYNGRPRPPQVLLDTDGRLVLARRRGSIRALG
jgi:diaminopimelate decarboxylase